MQSNVGSCITLGEEGIRIHLFEDDDGLARPISVIQ
jgi:hypothetical protein